MPTPVSSARQCLTEEAARALDDAVTVARRRSHYQTTSLHAVSALLSLPTSTLRDACARARNSAHSPRFQFRALELSVSVSLDRLPSSKNKTGENEPPVSNSLMTAIKRSQGNQRRHPDTFHLYQMHQQLYNSQSSLSCVTVELKHFVLSILDDPIVSRVFGDAGFRSTDIKIAILNPPSVSGFSKLLRFPPLFLCNLPDSSINSDTRIGFNFPFAVNHEEEDYKRIGLVLVKKSLKNPLLIGVTSDIVLTGFIKSLHIEQGQVQVGFMPSELEGLSVIDVDKEIVEFVSGDLSKEMMSLKMKEVNEKVESCEKCGVIVNFGDLKVFGDGGLAESVVLELSNLVRVCGGKLWLIGSVGSYETYMKILEKFPGLEKDWDLNLLPVTSSKMNSSGSPLTSSLMRSFVPFGGFFPVPNELENSSSKTDQSLTRCILCNKKYEHEVSIVLKGGRMGFVADQQSAGLASWLQIPESDSVTGNNVIEAKDHCGLFNARVIGLERKWNDICHRLHHNPPTTQNNFQIAAITTKESYQESNCRNLSPPVDFFATTSSTTTTTSITTDLGLGTIYVSPNQETRHQSFHGPGSADFKQLYRALLDKVGYQNDSIRAISQTISKFRTGNGRCHVWLSFSGSDRVGKQKITAALAEVVFGSRESLISIDLNSENQTCHQGSIFNCQGVKFSDPLLRGKTVTDFIAEELTKKPRSIVLLENIDKSDFLTQDKLSQAVKTGRLSDTRGRDIRITDAIFVTTVGGSNESDYLNYSEERILNAKALEMRVTIEKGEPGSSSVLLLPKESILRNPEMSKKRKFIEIGDFEIFMPKVKKLKSCFDLNISFEENENSDNEDVSDSKEVWLEEFLEQMDEKVVFDPFDFDSCSETILKEISKSFRKSFGTNVVLEIGNEVIVQILASCWLLSDQKGGVENWIETVLYKGFIEARQKQLVDNESIVKLVAVEGVRIENDALCVCLPSKVMVK